MPMSESAIVLAPRGRDAAVAAAILRESGIATLVAEDVAALERMLRLGAGFAVVTDEAFRSADLRGVARFVEDQQEWSDLPFIMLTERGGGIERNPAASRLLEMLGNVTFLERPFHPTTLVSLARSALRARRRQYDARARLETIREGEARMRVALKAGGLGAWILHLPERELESSPESKAHFGRGPDDPFDFAALMASIHPDDRDRLSLSAESSVAGGNDYNVEFRCVRPDGSVRWLQTRARLERGAGDEIVRMVGVTHDISERKAYEAQLRAFAAELEQRVEQRTREREDALAQLHEAQKLETLGQLTGGVAHDFNNLLTPIIGGLDMLRRQHADARSQRLIGGALQASERARTLVSRLLAFARRQALEARPVDPAALVSGMVDLIRRSLGPQIEIALEFGDALPPAMVDPNQLELALLNLSVNARDAMPEGGLLTIALAQEAGGAGMPPGRYIRFAITDTGSGMDEETLRRAVEPFYSTKGVGKGTGLGLSMVHGLAAQSGGALRLRSTPGAGTTAELWLPVAVGAAAPHIAPTEELAARIAPLRILLVDDEDLVRLGTADMLIEQGHEVMQASSGAQALTLLRGAPCDLLISDYLMPTMTGIELAGEARRIRPGLPVLLITGFADLPEQALGDIARLAKPFRERELTAALAGLAGKRSPALSGA